MMRKRAVRLGGWMLAVLLAAGVAGAEVTTERSGSILVFPKVVADGVRDTIIQITNTSNSMVHAHCFYVNGALTFPDQPPGPNNPPLWTEVDFDIWLTKQQPTYWLVSEGRLVDPQDLPCSAANDQCPNAGFDPGRVPPVVPDFTGELKCIEVDAAGAPLSGNHLKGEATLVTQDVCIESTSCSLSGNPCTVDEECTAPSDVAKYNGLAVIGNENNNGDPVLCLGGGVTDECPNGAEYNACPQTWILNHWAYGAENPVIGEGSGVRTGITVVPCAQDFETQIPETVTIQFAITNEYEQTFSASTSVTCWAELGLTEINPVFDVDFLSTDFVQTRMRPSSGTASGFMVIAEEVHTSDMMSEATFSAARGGGGGLMDARFTTTAVNLHVEGERPGPDRIVIPAEQIQ